eukprot:4599580-Pyramimonas_sp.AAC.1
MVRIIFPCLKVYCSLGVQSDAAKNRGTCDDARRDARDVDAALPHISSKPPRRSPRNCKHVHACETGLLSVEITRV